MRFALIPGKFSVSDALFDDGMDMFHDALCRLLTEVKGRDLDAFGEVIRFDDVAQVWNPAKVKSVRWLVNGNVTSLPFSRSKDGWGVATALATLLDGSTVIVSIGHTPAHHFIGKNKRAWTDGLKGWAKQMAAYADQFPGVPQIIAADFNKQLNARNMRAIERVFGRGFKFTWRTDKPNRGTHGRRVIDGVMVKGLSVDRTNVYAASKGFDHRPSTHDLSPKTVEVPPVATEDPYDIIQFRGAKMDRITAQALSLAEFILGYELTITQGSYNKGGVSASAGTHDGGGVIDLAPFEADRKVRILRALGFAAWHREPIPGLWPEHVHAVLIGNKKLAPAAVNQVASYRAGRDGLKSNAVDNTPRPDPIPVFRYGARLTIPRKKA